jgi:sugar O-acyltransferase (sialic acid O-acetyltransferase NeuD family)
VNREGELIVWGAGGHGKVVADTALRAGFSLAGFADDAAALYGFKVLGFPVFGGREWLCGTMWGKYQIALGIGDNYLRMAVMQWLRAHRFPVATIISPNAVVASSARIDEGSVIMPGAVVNADAMVGRGSILNTASVVEHDVRIGNYAHLSPNATLGGGARVGELTQIGIGAMVLPLIRVGARSIVGAGSVVARDIPDEVVAFGTPARVQRSIASGNQETTTQNLGREAHS